MENNEILITNYIEGSIRTKQELLKNNIPEIARVADIILNACRNGNTIFWFGNGGSAADAQHLACELVSMFFLERKPLASIALTTNTSELTAIANDYHFNQVFARQVEALVKSGDIVIGISTSGTSPSVIESIRAGKRIGAITVAFTGAAGGKLRAEVDYLLSVPSDVTPHIQESHIMIGHVICYLVEKKLFGET